MAEFRLTDNPKELAEGQKEKRSAVPSTQDNRPAGAITTSVPEVPTEDNSLFKIVECMPEFPGGMKGCRDFIQAEMCYPEEAKKAAVEQLAKLENNADKETAIELLLSAKGFDSSVVTVSDTNVDAVINVSELSDTDKAQIEDIIKRKTGFAADKITINICNN